MKDRLPLDRRQFFEYLRLRAAHPEIFRSERMLRIDRLPSCDRRIVLGLKPAWNPGKKIEFGDGEVRSGAWKRSIGPDEMAVLKAIDGERTIAQILSILDETPGSYDRSVRLFAVLAASGILILRPA
jgi:hypothetical protein